MLAEFLKEYRLIQPERRRVNRRFPDLQPIAFCGLSELPGELERDAIVVCYYLDHLSLLVEKGLVEEKDIMQDPRWID